MFNSKYSGLLLLCFTFLTSSLSSQIIVQGTVTDNGGEYLGNGAEPVINALVTITDQTDANRSFSTNTDEQGHYTIEITTTGVEEDCSANPKEFQLHQNYPNPFNPSTVIDYEIAQPCHVCINIYSVSGQKVKTLLNSYQNSSGQVIWDASDDLGKGVPAGLYIYSMQAEGMRLNRKMLLIDGNYGSIEHVTPLPVVTMHASNSGLDKLTANLYTLEVIGEDIETYEQKDLEIVGDMAIGVSVTRIVTDIDGNVYKTVKIGNQWWMAENLKVTHYCNGDPIPNVTDSTEWMGLSTGAYCAYENNETIADTYGYLYNWYAATNNRNIAPEAWHVPTDEEWKTLEMALGMSQSEADNTGSCGTIEGSKLAGRADLWHHGDLENKTVFGESGFSALPAGFRNYEGAFFDLGYDAPSWSATEYSSSAWYRSLHHYSSAVHRYNNTKFYGFSIRLLQD